MPPQEEGRRPKLLKLRKRQPRTGVPQPQNYPPPPPPVDFDTPTPPGMAQESTETGLERSYVERLASNAVPSFLNLAKGIFVDLPVYLGSRASEIARNPGEYLETMKDLYAPRGGDYEPLKASAKTLWDNATEKYEHGVFEAFADDPAGTLADFTGIVTLAGGSAARLGKLGKLASLEKAGNTLAKVSNAIDPIVLMGKGALKAGQPVLKHFGITERTIRMNNRMANETAEESAVATENILNLAKQGLTDAEKAAFDWAISPGIQSDVDALAPHVRKRLESALEILDDVERDFEYSGMLQNSQMLNRETKGAAIKLLRRAGKEVTEESVEQMGAFVRAEQKAGRMNPRYHRLEAVGHLDEPSFFDKMNPTGRKASFGGRLKKLFGRADEYETDPTVYLTRAQAKYHELKIKRRQLDIALDDLVRSNEIVAVRSAKDVPPGYRELPIGIIKTYLEAEQRALNVAVQHLAAKRAPGIAKEAAIAEILSDAKLMSELKEARVVAIPADVQAFLSRKMAIPGPVMRAYDNSLNWWKAFATIMNPGYWISVPVSNSILGVFFGLSPSEIKMALANADRFPAETRGAVAAELATAPTGVLNKFFAFVRRKASGLDDWLRQGIFVKEVSEQVRTNVQLAQRVAVKSEDDMLRAVQRIARAPEQMSRVQAKVLRLNERAAIQSADLLSLERKKDALDRALFKQSERLGSRPKSANINDPVYGRSGEVERPVTAPETFPTTGKPGPVLGRTDAPAVDPVTGAPVEKVVEPGQYGFTVETHGTRIPTAQKEGVQYVTEYMDEVTGQVVKVPLEDAAKVTQYRPPARTGSQDYDIITGQPIRKGDDRPVRVTRKKSGVTDPFTGKPYERERFAEVEIYPTGEVHIDPALLSDIHQGYEYLGRLDSEIQSLRASVMQSLARSGKLDKLIPELAPLREAAERGIVAGNNIVGAYYRLMPFEKEIFKRLVPFYTYTKMITMLAFRLPFLYPVKTFMWHQLAKMVNDLVYDKDTQDWVKFYAPVAIFEDGSLMMVRLGSLSPMNNLRVAPIGDVGLPNIFDVVQQNPLIKVAYEQFGGVNRWSKRPISPGEMAVRLDNGTVVEASETGLHTKIETPPLEKSLLYLFPWTQKIEELLYGYMQTDRGTIVRPDALRDPTGEVMYPVELWQRIAHILGSPRTMRFDSEDYERRELLRKNSVYKKFVQALRYAPPEKKEGYLRVLQNWHSLGNVQR